MSGTNYNEQLNALNSQFNSLLNDYNTYSSLHKNNPGNNGYTNSYSQVVSNIQNINSQVLQLSSNIETALNDLLLESNDLNLKLDEQQNLQMQLKDSLGVTRRNVDSANVMIGDFKETYKEQYIKNVTTFAGIFLAIYVILKVYLIR